MNPMLVFLVVAAYGYVTLAHRYLKRMNDDGLTPRMREVGVFNATTDRRDPLEDADPLEAAFLALEEEVRVREVRESCPHDGGALLVHEIDVREVSGPWTASRPPEVRSFCSKCGAPVPDDGREIGGVWMLGPRELNRYLRRLLLQEAGALPVDSSSEVRT